MFISVLVMYCMTYQHPQPDLWSGGHS